MFVESLQVATIDQAIGQKCWLYAAVTTHQRIKRIKGFSQLWRISLKLSFNMVAAKLIFFVILTAQLTVVKLLLLAIMVYFVIGY